MRQTISAIAAAIAVMAASAVPAMACGGGGCHYVSPCAQDYVAVPEYSNYYSCAGWGYGRLPDPLHQYYPDPIHQYYYVNQGPTYDGPGEFAPYPTYHQSALGYHRPVIYTIVGTTGGRPAIAITGTITAQCIMPCAIITATAAITDRPIDEAHRFKRAVSTTQPIRPSRLAPI